MRREDITAAQLTAFAQAIDVPLIYVMKLDAYGCLDYERVMDWFLAQEFDRIKKETGGTDARIYEAMMKHYGVSKYNILVATGKVTHDSSKK